MSDQHAKSPLLEVHPCKIGNDGIELSGEIDISFFDLPNTDRIKCPNPLSVDLRISVVSHNLLVQGTVGTTLHCRCDKCLQYYDKPLKGIEVCRYIKIEDEDVINLTEDIREDILLDFPTRVVCKTNCQGLCPNCGQNLNVRDCGCDLSRDGEDVWSVLDAFDPDDSGE
jgi:uncharacterized protein